MSRLRSRTFSPSRWAEMAAIGLLSLLWLGVTQARENREPPVPLAGLTGADLARFEEGRQLFEFPFTPRDGLGPIFNARACEACHHVPTIGGHGPGYRGNTRYAEAKQGARGNCSMNELFPASLLKHFQVARSFPSGAHRHCWGLASSKQFPTRPSLPMLIQTIKTVTGLGATPPCATGMCYVSALRRT